MTETELYRITAPHFVAGLEVDAQGVIVRTASILWRRFYGLPFSAAVAECDISGWTLEHVPPREERT